MAHQKQRNIIRTDYLENWIGFYRAWGDIEKAHALCKIARDIGAPISSEEVDFHQKIHGLSASFIKS